MCKDVSFFWGGGLKSINVFFSGDENVMVIKNCPFLVPVNEPVLLVILFSSIVYLMIGSIVKRKSLGNGKHDCRRGASKRRFKHHFFPLLVSTGSLHPPFKRQTKPFTFQQAADVPYTQCPLFPKTH